jgi:hypothetical protein
VALCWGAEGGGRVVGLGRIPGWLSRIVDIGMVGSGESVQYNSHAARKKCKT